MEIAEPGQVTEDSVGRHRSAPIPVPVLGNKFRHVLVAGYVDDAAKMDSHAAVGSFLSLGASVLNAFSVPVFGCYLDGIVHYRFGQLLPGRAWSPASGGFR